MSFPIEPIGFVRDSRDEVRDDQWGGVTARIELDDMQFGPEALAGLADFSHVEVIFVFDRVNEAQIERGARHPRNRQDWPLVGIFSQRGKNRPNRLGASIAEVVSVDGLVLTVRGLDAVTGTPVVDLKPVMREFLPRGTVRQPDWATELMARYYDS